MASRQSHGSHWQRIHSAERIRAVAETLEDENAGVNKEALETRRAKMASDNASKKMEQFIASSDGTNQIASDAASFLVKALESPGLVSGAAELLLQGIVLTWSALETLSRDVFELVLNSDPQKALAVLQEPSAKQRLQSKFTLEELASFGFNVSTSLGSLLSSQQDFSDIRTIKAALMPLLGSDPALATALGDPKLWMLCQQRHLIVHRRGIVDERYLAATGESRQRGTRLTATPSLVKSYFEAVQTAGTALLMAAKTHAA